LEFALKDKFIIGMIAGSILDRLLEKDEAITTEKALQIAQRKETVVKTQNRQQQQHLVH
jgi:hypothetical protein